MSVLEQVAPRICSVPDSTSSAGAEAVELAAMAGLYLDPWQAFVLEHSLGERADGKWAAFEVGLVVSRQNGKGSILEARELAGLFLLGERLIIHSAHQFDTSLEAFRRLLFLIEDCPDFDRRVKSVSRSHGQEGIELKGGQRIRFRTRTKSGGRGFTGDCVILDEAMILPVATHGALLPIVSARPNPQIWYTGSAVDQYVQDDGIVLAKIRERGWNGADPSLAYFEWSAIPQGEEDERGFAPGAADSFLDDPDAWRQANPAFGIRISEEHIEYERRALDDRTFCVERLGIGDWPVTDGTQRTPIAYETWKALIDLRSKPEDPVVFAFDVTPDRSSASIAVAGRREDGLSHVEIVDHHRGTGWVAARVAELQRHAPTAIICDASGPAASLLHELEDLGVSVQTVTAGEHGQACGQIFDMVAQNRLRHLGTPELTAAVKGAAARPLGDAWAWSRKNSAVDISPLVAVTLALWGSGVPKEAATGWRGV